MKTGRGVHPESWAKDALQGQAWSLEPGAQAGWAFWQGPEVPIGAEGARAARHEPGMPGAWARWALR